MRKIILLSFGSLLVILAIIIFSDWYDLKGRELKGETKLQRRRYMLQDEKTAQDYFHRFELIIGKPLPCMPVGGQSVEPCLTDNIEFILKELERKG